MSITDEAVDLAAAHLMAQACMMCDQPVKWFEPPYGEWLHENRSIYCTGKASVATPNEGAKHDQ